MRLQREEEISFCFLFPLSVANYLVVMVIQCCFLVVSQAQCIEQLVGCSDLQFLSHYFDY